MSRYGYFDDLSGNDSSDGGSCSSEDEDGKNSIDDNSGISKEGSRIDRNYDRGYLGDTAATASSHNTSRRPPPQPLLRAIVHADVDCFYCQCEILDRKLDPSRPLAIGQKHIVVTSNYAARALGITKLMCRLEAQRRCPSLLIVDGSDLERYRVHGRKIYEAFRRGFGTLRPGCSVAKGSMDEMMADLTIESDVDGDESNTSSPHKAFHSEQGVYIYNDQDGQKADITFVEDQSGAKTRLSFEPVETAASPPPPPRLLLDAVTTALHVRDLIHKETGFTVTMGVSYNPLLAKLASGLRKPGTANLISHDHHHRRDAANANASVRHLVGSMPLRKIPGIGHRTMKVLQPCLVARFGEKGPQNATPWTCRDLLQVPSTEIVKCLESVRTGEKSSADQCATLLDLCRGHDASEVVDDQGGLQKTLSIENSFRRGTITTPQQVHVAMQDLYLRLPRLLNNRSQWSTDPTRSYPRTIRLTVRSVQTAKADNTSAEKASTRNPKHRLPSVTRSLQMPFKDSHALLVQDQQSSASASSAAAALLLRRAVSPLLTSMLQSMLDNGGDINITRINIALCNFHDVTPSPKRTSGRS